MIKAYLEEHVCNSVCKSIGLDRAKVRSEVHEPKQTVSSRPLRLRSEVHEPKQTVSSRPLRHGFV